MKIDKVLVPLDGSLLAAAALPTAVELVKGSARPPRASAASDASQPGSSSVGLRVHVGD